MAPATLADIARQANLSVPTVSRALRDHPDVSLSTRQRVKEISRALGYQTSAAARALRTGRHQTLNLVLPQGVVGWWDPLTRGASEAAAAQGYHLMLTPIGLATTGVPVMGADELSHLLQYSSALPVDGFVLVTPEGDSWRKQTDRPLVIIDDVQRHPGEHVFLADNRGGARSATEHLLLQGRRKIIAVAPDWSGALVDDRLAGYSEAMDAAGLETTVVRTNGNYPPTDEYSSVIEQLIVSDAAFDGLFVLADYLTFSIFRSLRRAGVSIPHDVAVVGFDDEGLAAMATDPMLTTVAQPLADIGARAVETLVAVLRGEEISPTTHLLPTRLMVRGSA